MYKLSTFISIFFASFLFFVQVVAGQDMSSHQFLIKRVGTDTFPNVEIDFQVVDAANRPTRLITSTELIVQENGVELSTVSIQENETRGVDIIFFVDRGGVFGGGSIEWNLSVIDSTILRNSMKQLVAGEHFREGMDSVTILMTTRENDNSVEIVLDGSQSAAEFVSAVNALDFSVVPGRESYVALEDAAKRIMQSEQQSTALIYLGNIYDTIIGDETLLYTRLPMLAEQYFLPTNTPFYALHTAPSPRAIDTYQSHFEYLAEVTDGAYLQVPQRVDELNQTSDLDRLYASIGDDNISYRAVVRSQSATNDRRQITLASIEDGDAGTENATIGYQVSVNEPDISIISTGIVQRVGRVDGQFDTDFVDIQVGITSWPDGYPREIESAQLSAADDVYVQNNPTGETFNFTLDISKYKETTTLLLTVAIEDELGLVATASEQLMIEVTPPPTLTPTPLPTATPVTPTAVPSTPSPTATPERGGFLGWLSSPSDGANTNNSGNDDGGSGWILLLALPLGLLMLFAIFRKRIRQHARRLVIPVLTPLQTKAANDTDQSRSDKILHKPMFEEDEATADEVTTDEVTADEVTTDEVTADEVIADEVTADGVIAEYGYPQGTRGVTGKEVASAIEDEEEASPADDSHYQLYDLSNESIQDDDAHYRLDDNPPIVTRSEDEQSRQGQIDDDEAKSQRYVVIRGRAAGLDDRPNN